MNNVYMGLDVENFIFEEGTTYEESYSNVTDEEMNEFGIIECTEDPDVACYKIALENEQNHNAIMMAVLTQEYKHVLENGTEMVYEGSKIENFLDNVKKQIQKFWAKVKGVFKKLMDQISSFVLSNKAFVKKYRAASISTPKDLKEFTGYNFPENMDIDYPAVVKALGVIKDASSSEMKEIDDITDVLDLVRGGLVGKSSDVAANEFEKALKIRLYGSENTSVVKPEAFQTLLNRLETASSARKAAKSAYKEAEKAVKGLLSEVNKEKVNAKSDAGVARARKKSDIISKSLTLMSTAMHAQVRAIMASTIQDRKMANYYVNVQNKKGVKMQKESAVDFPEVEII